MHAALICMFLLVLPPSSTSPNGLRDDSEAGSGQIVGSNQNAGSPRETKPGEPSRQREGVSVESSANAVVVVTASRIDIPLKESPAATSVVTDLDLRSMPRGIAADEALKLVPGMKIDNQANGERVHMSIRGQGLLTERGIRGIKVLLDGLPLNDPTGFAPDLFDVDWNSVERVEVIRGPSSALYGGGAAGGVVSILTRDGTSKAIGGEASVVGGSNAFSKAFSELGGTARGINYRVSASHNQGDGYRDHAAFDATNLYGKFSWRLGATGRLTAIVAATRYFNENAEGLNLSWLNQDRRMANPDALTFNEYQNTRRITSGVTGQVNLASHQELAFSAYYRHTRWRESVPSSVQHRTFETPGAILQYRMHHGNGWLRNHFTAGADLDWQVIDEYRRPNQGLGNEGPGLLSQQAIHQRNVGLYLLDRLEFGRQWSLTLDARSDHIRNTLDDHLRLGGVDLSGLANFKKITGRVGASWNPNDRVGFYTSWGQGFLPPATEELANNPLHQGGFNTGLVPATSWGQEVGARGSLRQQLTYDVAVFRLDTKNDFGRYRVPSRPLETFYQNAGSSRRYGVETALGWYPRDLFAARLSYTFSDFNYTDIQSLFGNFHDKIMPNAPRHQAYLDLEYPFLSHWVAGLSGEMQSRSYVDATNSLWADGYGLLHARFGFRWKTDWYLAEIMASGRNMLGSEYIAFTEPDPDGNSFQPAPVAEFFITARVWFAGQ